MFQGGSISPGRALQTTVLAYVFLATCLSEGGIQSSLICGFVFPVSVAHDQTWFESVKWEIL
jgi:hypothetical protein